MAPDIAVLHSDCLLATKELQARNMPRRTAEESKKEYIAAMGHALGSQYAELWQEVVYLHRNWTEYVALFGTKPSRIKLINDAAPVFFRMVQDVLWEETLLHIARLTDPPESGKGKANLTVQNLPDMVADAGLCDKLQTLVKEILEQSEFCRDWRNRRIAHRDLSLALDEPAKPLENGSRKQVDTLLDLIGKIMNSIARYYLDSETDFRLASNHGGATALLYTLDDGIKAESARHERLTNGKPLEDDFSASDL